MVTNTDRSLRVCLLCHTIGPYHAARYSALAKRIPDIVVIQLARQHAKYPWINAAGKAGIPVETLCEGSIENLPERALASEVCRLLDRLVPDVVVSVGYSEAAMRAATLWARRHRALSLMVTDTWRGDKRRWFPLETAKRIWCSWAYDGLFIPGVRSFDYFASLGVPRNRIWRGASVVDNDHFCKGSKEAKERETELRKKYGLPEKYFLCVARLSPEKNLVRLLLAFDLYLRHGGNWHLVIVGSGPHSEILRSMALTRALDEVHFVGWQQYSELPVYYGLASVFILPSISEPWGLVVNEAMAAGLPVLVSRQAGCVPELVWRGINGYDFDPWDADALGELMMRMSSGAVDLVGMGEASQRIIANFTPETWADALRDCIHTVACLK